MIVIEVEMPTGFVADNERFKTQPHVKRHESKGKTVVLYFDGVSMVQDPAARKAS